MRFVLTGGKIDSQQLADLCAKGGVNWQNENAQSFRRWSNLCRGLGSTGYLRLLLVADRLAEAAPGVQRSNQYLLSFQSACGWRMGPPKDRANAPSHAEQFAQFETWLERYENQLSYDPKTRKFTGAPQPGQEQVHAALDKAKGKINFGEDVFAAGTDSTRRALFVLLAAFDADPAKAKDPDVAAALLECMDLSKGSFDATLSRSLILTIPKADAELGAEVIHRLMLEKSAKNKSLEVFFAQLFSELPPNEIQPSVLAQARAKTLPDTEKMLKAAGDNPDEWFRAAMFRLYCGGTVDETRLEKTLLQIHDTNISMLHDLLASTGSVSGLRLMLISARAFPDRTTQNLSKFDVFCGRLQSRWIRFETPEKLAIQLKSYQDWLDEHGKDLTFNAGMHRFELPPNVTLPPPLTDPAGTAPIQKPKLPTVPIKPPKPPEDQF